MLQTWQWYSHAGHRTFGDHAACDELNLHNKREIHSKLIILNVFERQNNKMLLYFPNCVNMYLSWGSNKHCASGSLIHQISYCAVQHTKNFYGAWLSIIFTKVHHCIISWPVSQDQFEYYAPLTDRTCKWSIWFKRVSTYNIWQTVYSSHEWHSTRLILLGCITVTATDKRHKL